MLIRGEIGQDGWMSQGRTWRTPHQLTKSRMMGVKNSTEATSGTGVIPGNSFLNPGSSGRYGPPAHSKISAAGEIYRWRLGVCQASQRLAEQVPEDRQRRMHDGEGTSCERCYKKGSPMGKRPCGA